MHGHVGFPVHKAYATLPPLITFTGRYVLVEPLDAKHIDDLYANLGQPEHHGLWTYLPAGPFQDKESFTEFIGSLTQNKGSVFYAVVDRAQRKAVGFFSLMRIDLENRVVEIGYIVFSPLLQRTTAATEAFYLTARAVFEDLHFRRLEWKCNDLNDLSKRAAARFGFTAEGVFRQHMVVKGSNRDTAWFSIIDSEWPALQDAFAKWLDPLNFDGDRIQRCSLGSFRRT
ncbi:acyl-CoA N-acyltransferase [Penicillium argentinense]|uniref:Acyl-CoA N-acyltransferase n=1 Tax=Penicillium argentinense TaxID=1131581 RepID=A0A9W9FCV2_9EURO|nr:acyl-CoA N-acyltransferase [Penicillium argentinense]KAJ5097812.1 acyl-CoA N-acyltransferase [Penicillium argentinense]